MPRMAASLAVFLTVVTCIGFNISQYPVVWKEVAASEDLCLSPSSAKSTAAGRQEMASQSALAAEPAAAPSPAVRRSAASRPRHAASVEPIPVYSGGAGEEPSQGWIEGEPVVAGDGEQDGQLGSWERPQGAGLNIGPGDEESASAASASTNWPTPQGPSDNPAAAKSLSQNRKWGARRSAQGHPQPSPTGGSLRSTPATQPPRRGFGIGSKNTAPASASAAGPASSPAEGAVTFPPETEGAGQALLERPLVAVSNALPRGAAPAGELSEDRPSRSPQHGGSGVRRLPPVDHVESAAAGIQSFLADDAIPIYPTTSAQ